MVLAHEGPLGLKPWSISTSALDVDAGDPGELMQAWPPMAVLNSRRAAGKHLYYADTEGRGNGHFEVYGCAGEIRSAKGYLILWHDGAGSLADALHDPLARARRWPRDLFELAGLPAVTLPGAVKTPTYSYKPSDQSRQTWAAAAAALELETIKRGLRNVTLFDSVRFWAYSVPRGQDLDAWTRRVRVHSLEQNRRFPEPLDESEVKADSLQHQHLVLVWGWGKVALRPQQRRPAAAASQTGEGTAGQESGEKHSLACCAHCRPKHAIDRAGVRSRAQHGV